MYVLKSALIAMFLTLTLASPALSVVRLGSVADFEPYNYLDDEGELQGFEAELGALICERAGLDCEWILAPWDDLIVDLLQNDIDVIMTGMQITAERMETIDFSDEYFPADPSAIMVMAGGLAPDSGSVVGTQTDTLQAVYITEQGWAMSTYASPENAVQALIVNEVNAILGDQAYYEQVMAANPGVFDLVVSDVVIGAGLGLGLRQSDDDTRAALNGAIASLKADGTLDALIGTWFAGRDPNYRGATTE